MFLSCPECGASYKLDELALGPQGRRVRCTNCRHVWRAMPPQPEPAKPYNDGAPFGGDKFATDKPISDNDMSISFDGDKTAEDFAFDPDAYVDPAGPSPEERASFAQHMGDIPDVVKPIEMDNTVAPYMPDDQPHYQVMGGLSANALGATMFLLPLLITIGLMVVFRAPLARHLPGLVPVYTAFSVPVAAPGEGLRLSALVAERQVDADKKTLKVSAQIANTLPQARPYPALVATLYGPYGAVLKTWDLPAPKGKMLASGEDAPIKIEFKDTPDAGAKIQLKVQEP